MKRVLVSYLGTLLALLGLFCLSACNFSLSNTKDSIRPFQGNAEGYSGIAKYKKFYLVEPDYRCTRPQDGVSISSYRSAIKIGDDGSVTYEGDLCSVSAQTISADDVELNASGEVAGYGRGLYQFAETVPVVDSPELLRFTAWCSASDLEFLVGAKGQPVQHSVRLYAKQSAGVRLLADFLVGLIVTPDLRALRSLDNPASFVAGVRINEMSNIQNKYFGRMEINRGETQITRDILCRYIPRYF